MSTSRDLNLRPYCGITVRLNSMFIVLTSADQSESENVQNKVKCNNRRVFWAGLPHSWWLIVGSLRSVPSRFPTKHQHGSPTHVVHGQIYQPIRNSVEAAAPRRPIRKKLAVTRQLSWLMPVIWLRHPWRQFPDPSLAPGPEESPPRTRGPPGPPHHGPHALPQTF